MPELASLRVAVMEESNRFLGHRIIPINALNSGKEKGSSLVPWDLRRGWDDFREEALRPHLTPLCYEL
jgi:hypothetical protein